MVESPLGVTYDDQIFTFSPRSGVARYFTELIRAYRAEPSLGVEALTPFRYTVTEHLLELDSKQYRRAPLPAFAQRPKVLRPLNRIASRKSAKKPDLLHHTHYAADTLERPAHLRLCTVYDMIPELFPELFTFNPHKAKREYVEACDAVLCISQSTKDDLLAVYGTLDKPVVVTHLGVSQSFFDAPPKQDGPDYVIYMGQRFLYKNFDVLLRAFTQLAVDRPQLSLICVGPPFNPDETARLAELGLADRVRQRGADDGQLPALFSSALCLVFPSKYEGFGLPIVEAFASGCPVILADMPCSVEIGGDAAQYFSADSGEELAGLIDQMAGDPSSRDAWVSAGRLRALDFTWRHTAEVTRDVYRDLAAHR